MINLTKAKFIKSCASKKDFLLDKKQVVFLGRSNVGKSSLINSLCNNKKLVYVSSTPGRTKLISYFDVEQGYLVDAPGYGYYKDGTLEFENLMLDYFSITNKYIKRCYILLDSRREISTLDEQTLSLIQSYNLNANFIFTKMDKLSMSDKDKLLNQIEKLLPNQRIFFTSSKDKKGLEDVTIDINNAFNEK